MINNLPTHGFLWKKGKDFTPEKIDKHLKKDEKGYLLEVNVDYPKQLHENHNELPFLTERMKIGRVEKLVPNLKDKKGYVVHIQALDQALKHGLKLKKGAPGYGVSTKQMDKGLYYAEYQVKERCKE